MLKIKNLMQSVQIKQVHSVKGILLAFVLFSFAILAKAQPAYYNNNSGTAYNAFPLNSTASNKVQWIFGPSLFKTAGATGTTSPTGAITKIYFRLGTTVNSSASYSNFTLSLSQNQGTATAFSSSTLVTGLTTVFSASSFALTGATATAWYGITLSTPFYYDPTQSLVFEMKVSGGSGNTIAQFTGTTNQRSYAGYSATTGTPATGLVDFGIDVKTSKNEVYNLGLTSLNNTCGSTADPVIIQIKNTGVIDMAANQNIPLRAVVSGASSATLNKLYNRALKVGNTDTIHMGNLNTTAITGNINLKSWITMPLDSVQANDTNLAVRTFIGSTKPTLSYNIAYVCDTVKFTNTSKNICNFIWEFDNGKTSTVLSPNHSFNSPGTYNVKLLAFYGAGLRDSLIRQVVVAPRPVANFTANNQCFGTAVDFSNFSYAGSTYLWSFGDATTSTLASPSRNYGVAGTFAVKLVVTNLNRCRDSITKNVTVFPKPVANFTPTAACAGANVSFNNASTGGASFNWDLGDGTTANFFNPAKNYNTAGTYAIKLTVVNTQGCSDAMSKTLTINPLPVSSFNVQNNCRGLFTPFTNNSTGAASYLWSFGDGNTSNSLNPSIKYTLANTYTVSLMAISALGCNHTSVKTVTIHTLPKANFSANDVCDGVTTDFTNLTVFPPGGGDYIWKFGDGNTSTDASPKYKYAASGAYDVKLVATSISGCKDSASTSVEVFAKPKPNFTVSDVCDGQTVTFFNNSTGIASQTWDFGDATTNSTFSPTHVYAGPNFYKVTLSVTSNKGCKETVQGSVTVHPNPELVFFAEDHCFGTSANFTNLSVGTSSVSWTFGDGDSTTSTQTTHTYKNTGTYNVKLRGVSSKGCSVQKSKSIKVFTKPTPNFSAPTVCVGLTTQFTNTSTGAATYAWNFGDGSGSSTAMAPSYQYFNAGNYKVVLTTTSSDNCVEQLAKTITVAAAPIPIFIAQDVCTGVEVKPTNLSQGAITSQTWSFGDGATDTAKSPSHTYANPGIYTLKLKLNSALGCSDSTSKTILIYTKPIIMIGKDMVISKGYSAQLLASGGTDYLWTPAESLDNPISPNPMASPDKPTRYTVKVMNAFGCFDTASVNVSLIEDFTIEPQNLITPNDNGQNDIWKIKGIEFYPNASVMVFDQWGRIIINKTGYKNDKDNAWDGTFKGKPLPDGTYYYVITLPGTERQHRGTINILRN